MPERELRIADDDSRPGWVLVEVVDGDRVISWVWVPREPLVPIPGDGDA